MKKGDIVVCLKTYVETEFAHGWSSNLKYSTNDRLVHLTQSKKYKVEDINIKSDRYLNKLTLVEIGVINDFGILYYYDFSRFLPIKEWRRKKLQKIMKVANENK